MSLRKQLDFLFDPRSVAVIGASNQIGKWGYVILARLQASRSKRPIYAVNNREDEVLGLKAYKSVVDVPGPVDLAVITVPFQHIIDVMHDCVRKGVRVGIIITSGMAEIGGDGVKLERQIVDIARKGGMRLCPPRPAQVAGGVPAGGLADGRHGLAGLGVGARQPRSTPRSRGLTGDAGPHAGRGYGQPDGMIRARRRRRPDARRGATSGRKRSGAGHK